MGAGIPEARSDVEPDRARLQPFFAGPLPMRASRERAVSTLLHWLTFSFE